MNQGGISRLLQVQFQGFAFSDVPAQADKADDLTIQVTRWDLGRKQPSLFTFLIDKIVFPVEHGLAAQNHLVVSEETFRQFLRENRKIILSQNFGFG